ncbi:MAG: 4Fe-4S binding protein [Defluviitaleaceae bacterium]|nr:4Fe-4S binding protein [Defluviitaleaceae bacterium]
MKRPLLFAWNALGLEGRLLAQIGFFILQNPFLKNFVTGEIYRGKLKHICTPGLNCYACPAAAFSCPIGAAQMFFAGARHSISLYVTGFLLTVGVIFGKFICGFVCPMGFLQDLLYKIKTPKLVTPLRFLRYVKYFVLVMFVVLLPVVFGSPMFCAYICPSGTIFGAVPLLAVHNFLFDFIGWQFVIKAIIAVGVLIISVFVLRIFCRVLCPLGAIYSLLNRIAIFRMKCDEGKCTSCKSCADACDIMTAPNHAECFRCGKCVAACPQKALSRGA